VNPFDLTGPYFLVFFALVLCLGAGLLTLFWSFQGNGKSLVGPLVDPYAIAYLRGGPKEAVKIAVASLAHRRWVSTGVRQITTEEGKLDLARNNLEKAILFECINGKTFEELCRSRPADVAKSLYQEKLFQEGLILSRRQIETFAILKGILILTAVSISLTKISIGLQKGKPVLFLFLLTAAGILGIISLRFWKTPLGKQVLKDLSVLFERLKGQQDKLIRPEKNRDFSYLTAVFGTDNLGLGFSYLSVLRPVGRPSTSSSDCSSSSCSGGSSCGGGCGGGCGGCGG